MTQQQQEFLSILRQELVPALGCTEPIAIAYAATRARRLLGSFPERMVVSCSGNIINIMKPVRTANYERADRTAPGHVQRICYTATVTA